MESQASRIGVEQSQSDRSKRHYEPLQYVILQFLSTFFPVKFVLSKFAKLVFLITANQVIRFQEKKMPVVIKLL